MVRRRPPAWRAVLPLAAWLILLALLPWWLGLSLLLALAIAVTVLQRRLADEDAALIRRALRWGLPGMLFALQRTLGGDAFAWGAALLGALAGYTMLAGLEAWLDRELRRAPAAPFAEWPELAMAPIGPAAEIIELQPPAWQLATGGLPDPLGGGVAHRDGAYVFEIGERIAGADAPVAFSPGGRWFAAQLRHGRGVLLWDRQRERQHRLRGWRLDGWYREQPYLVRRDGDMPLALATVLGGDDADET
ncbi:hypothetical protein RHOFW104T7_05790 [Rhodanobacter thiooxydans]|uniref:Uncharacterized protein n=1 Tax=Rhodanobacter thiooxydans TaxID=416169 RepID=A0A154QLR3_9GAMM|nr:hypothetical protein [Rhodanobacter thiooxydans]KZC25021.1 hypothetical protein RHOFW104T7_05790 [Rhodanobacter thiooxydans]MCW0202823.1 hypothetical protein [Rhodanobacter thiooxydans]